MIEDRIKSEIVQRTVLSELIGDSISLQRRGNTFVSCCPFHNEKTPSFHINDDKGFYHCFGCEVSGDAFQWLIDFKKLSFPEALKELADRSGVQLPKYSAKDKEKISQFQLDIEFMEWLKSWYHKQLLANSSSLQYLTSSRKLSLDTIKSQALGFSPKYKSFIDDIPADKQKWVEIAQALGIIKTSKQNRKYDAFYGRIMFPVLDYKNRCIAFGGRVLDDQQMPKYINSAENRLFSKKTVLFNFRNAIDSRQKDIIVVEGYIDVIALTNVNINNTVATLGTAISVLQMQNLWKRQCIPILCFDGDTAGLNASYRATKRLLPDINVNNIFTVVTLPLDKDPDQIIMENGKQKFYEIVEGSLNIPEFLFQFHFKNINQDDPNHRAKAELNLINDIAEIKDNILKRNYTSDIKDKIFRFSRYKKKTKLNKIPSVQTSYFDREIVKVIFMNPDLILDVPEIEYIDIYNDKINELLQFMISTFITEYAKNDNNKISVEDFQEIVDSNFPDLLKSVVNIKLPAFDDIFTRREYIQKYIASQNKKDRI
ncbi:MAG: DNA primase [Alphaproteobacteria bacterium]|nr:DNA primase [Alphaproteobacteria bacterium]